MEATRPRDDSGAAKLPVIEDQDLTQFQAAEILGIDRPKVSALIRGKLSGCSMDRMFWFLSALDNGGRAMKSIGLKEAKANLSRFLDNAQHERILITRRGRPTALVIGVEGHDLEQIVLGSDAEFWKMIEERRKRPATLTSDDVRRSFGIPPRAERGRSTRSRRRS